MILSDNLEGLSAEAILHQNGLLVFSKAVGAIVQQTMSEK